VPQWSRLRTLSLNFSSTMGSMTNKTHQTIPNIYPQLDGEVIPLRGRGYPLPMLPRRLALDSTLAAPRPYQFPAICIRTCTSTSTTAHVCLPIRYYTAFHKGYHMHFQFFHNGKYGPLLIILLLRLQRTAEEAGMKLTVTTLPRTWPIRPTSIDCVSKKFTRLTFMMMIN